MSDICLNMIVKNEAANLPRALASVEGHVSSYAILDTGSTDNTIEVIQEWGQRTGIPGTVERGIFKDFSQARNDALKIAQYWGAGSGPHVDYFLLMDADMELVINAPLPELGLPAYALVQEAGGMAYYNARLLHHAAEAKYVGATHEYLSVEGIGRLTEWKFRDYATGANRGDKLARDAKLLRAELKEQPNNPRTLFYLAQTLKESGKLDPAMRMYERHRQVSDWDEERFYSLFEMARIRRKKGDMDGFIRTMQNAYNERPSRPEPLYELARYHREKGENALAWLYADAGSRLPPCGDVLFLDTDPQRWGFLAEKGITGFYQPHTYAEGFRSANKMALQLDAPPWEREQARSNLGYYIRPITDLASWRAIPVPFTPPREKYTASNPSIAVYRGEIVVLARTVNYVIRSDGSYDMQGDDAIKTTNYLVPLTEALKPARPPVEIRRPAFLPSPVFPPVQGFEDMRLIAEGNHLWASSTVREQNEGGVCEQWLSRVQFDSGETEAHKMPTPARYGHAYEKNWMPVVDRGKVLFMYRPGVVIDQFGTIVHDNTPTIAADAFSGGSQLLFWEGGWIGLVHEARMDPAYGYSKRYYQHRVVWYDGNFVLRKVSMPFFFERKQIEFCAGLAWHPCRNDFLITYSTNDATAMIGSISHADMRSLLWEV